jgi:hypothetical protein
MNRYRRQTAARMVDGYRMQATRESAKHAFGRARDECVRVLTQQMEDIGALTFETFVAGLREAASRRPAGGEAAHEALADLMDQLEAVGIAVPGEDAGQWADVAGLSFARAYGALGVPVAEPEAELPRHAYALVNRPAGIGTVPRDVRYTVEPRPERSQAHSDVARHGVLVTERALTAEEVRAYELRPLVDGESAHHRLAVEVVAGMGRYRQKILERAGVHPEWFRDDVLKRAEVSGVSVGDPDALVHEVLRRLKAERTLEHTLSVRFEGPAEALTDAVEAARVGVAAPPVHLQQPGVVDEGWPGLPEILSARAKPDGEEDFDVVVVCVAPPPAEGDACVEAQARRMCDAFYAVGSPAAMALAEALEERLDEAAEETASMNDDIGEDEPNAGAGKGPGL